MGENKENYGYSIIIITGKEALLEDLKKIYKKYDGLKKEEYFLVEEVGMFKKVYIYDIEYRIRKNNRSYERFKRKYIREKYIIQKKNMV